MDEVSEIKNMSIVDYLSNRGFVFIRKGRYRYCKSPFSEERTPSFCVYPTNTFYDWSNSIGGDIIRLVQEMEGLEFNESIEFLKGGVFTEIKKEEYKKVDEHQEEFILDKYIERRDSHVRLIREYAFKRGITRFFHPSKFFVRNKDNGRPESKPSIGFVHVDENMNICGIKMRSITGIGNSRFSARGKQKFYILRNKDRVIDKNTVLYIVESESSANSMFEFLEFMNINSVVVSFGSWSNIPEEFPGILSGIKKRKLIIDYDGSEDLYERKISKFECLEAEDIKLKLPKGEDVNSLYVKGLIFKYKNFLIND